MKQFLINYAILAGCYMLLRHFWNRRSERRIMKASAQNRRMSYEEMKRVINDDICQRLAAIKMQAMDPNCNTPNAIVSRDKLLEGVIYSLQKLYRDFGGRDIIQNGLYFTISGEIEQLNKEYPVKFVFINSGEPVFLKEDADITIYRIYRAALENAIQHSGASDITVSLNYTRWKLILSIVDNGHGIPVVHKERLGLKNMMSRVRALHGTMNLESYSTGTSIIVKIPKRRNA